LAFSRSQGNDLSTAHPPHFPGLKSGDNWALCATRWLEGQQAGQPCFVKLEATNIKALEIIPLQILQQYGGPIVNGTMTRNEV
jgi:uncharacterized protein (DUF2237 family)